jgi:hypothetical protein
LRLRALSLDTWHGSPFGCTDYRELESPHLHPNTAVILFVADLPRQPSPTLPGNMGVIVGNAPAAPHAQVDAPNLPKDLGALGVHVLVVKIKLDTLWQQQLTLPGAVPLDLTGDHVKVLANALDFTGSTASAKASKDRVSAELAAELNALTTGQLIRQRSGRVIDGRTLPTRTAPYVRTVLGWPINVAATLDASVKDPAQKQLKAGDKRLDEEGPLIVSQVIGEGRVVVLGYSPFAYDMWQQDVGEACWPGTTKLVENDKVDGWGVQRLIDVADRTAAVRPLRSFPVVRGVRELEDGATILIDCWTHLLKNGKPVAAPQLEWRDGGKTESQPLRMVAADLITQTATYQFSPTKPLRTEATLVLAPGGVVDYDARTSLHINLTAADTAGRTTAEALGYLAGLSGGGVVTPEKLTEVMEFRLPLGWLAVPVALLLVGLLYSPLCRPWGPALAAWKRLVARRQVARLREPPRAEAKVLALLADWGRSIGAPQAARQAGVPSGMRPFQSGDQLGTAPAGELLPFTTPGRAIGLPQRRPRVRLRQSTRAMEAVLWVDFGQWMALPDDPPYPTKADMLQALLLVAAGAVWLQSGSVRLHSIQDPTRVWGPARGQDSAYGMLAAWRAWTRQAATWRADSLTPPRDLEPGHVLIVFSDLLAYTEEQWRGLAEHCGREGVSLRVLHLRHPRDADQLGTCQEAVSGRLLDRTDTHPTELTAALQRFTARVEHYVRKQDGRFLTVSTTMTAVELLDALADEQFFQ